MTKDQKAQIVGCIIFMGIIAVIVWTISLNNAAKFNDWQETVHRCKAQVTSLEMNPSAISPECASFVESYKANKKAGAIVNGVKPKPGPCESPKKDGTYDFGLASLSELAQNWVFFRRQAMQNPSDESAHRNFDKANAYLGEYPDEAVKECIESFESP